MNLNVFWSELFRTEPEEKILILPFINTHFFALNVQPQSVILRMAPVGGATSPREMVSTGSEGSQQRCLRTTLATRRLRITPQTAVKVCSHT